MRNTFLQRLLLVVFFLIMQLPFIGYSQHQSSQKHQAPVLHHDIDVYFGSSHIPKGSLDNSNAKLITPNLGINYKYWFDEHFAIGLYTNVVTLNYVINSDSHQDLERTFPVTMTAVGVFRFWKRMSFFAGPGVEFDKSKNLFVIRLGLDYAFNLSNDWHITPRFIFDTLGNEIQVYTIGLSFGRRF